MSETPSIGRHRALDTPRSGLPPLAALLLGLGALAVIVVIALQVI